VVVQRLDPKDPGLLDELAAGLYKRLRSRLRDELIADRERSGNLTEFS
jgi:archaellum biogenesis protein FlaJ (TadC family)